MKHLSLVGSGYEIMSQGHIGLNCISLGHKMNAVKILLIALQGDHSTDNVKFPGDSVTVCGTRRVSVTRIMPILVLLLVLGVGMQEYMIRNHILNI